MPASPPDVALRLYEDALLDLARAARSFAAAIDRAREASVDVGAGEPSPLVERVLDDCRGALVPALVRAPGMLQLFAHCSS